MKLIFLVLPFLLSACSYNGQLGSHDQFEVNSRTELFAPSVTVITEKESGRSQVVGGQSVISQLQGAASAAIFGSFVSSGLKGSGDNVTSNNITSSGSDASSSSKSSSTSVDIDYGRGR
jgi:hypothetical protein